MKIFALFFTTMLFSFAIFCPAQKIIPIEKTKESAAPPSSDVTEISEREWQTVIDALRLEDWDKAAFMAAQMLSRIKTDNDKKQIAQLRYIYLYSLAGKVINYSQLGKKDAEDATRRELRAAAADLMGKELVMFPRQFLGECDKVLNYICRVKDNENALRVTTTNKDGTAIHSFEYVIFDQKIDLKEFAGKETFLGGILTKAEFNETESNRWITRLFFDHGFARVVVSK